jgi:hypothetical protein
MHCHPLGAPHGFGSLHWNAAANRHIEPPTTLMLRPVKAARRCERVDVRRMYSRQLEARET